MSVSVRLAALAVAATLAGAAPALAGAPADEGAYHVFRLHQSPTPATPPAGGKTMLYFAGPVLANVKVVSVFWGNGVNKVTTAKIGGYLSAMVNSTFLDQLAQYSTNIVGVNGRQGTNQTIGRGTFLGDFKIAPTNKSKHLTNAQIQTEIMQQIAAGHLPARDLNTLYMIYFPANVTISLGGGLSCQSFGAYHFSTSRSNSPDNLFYAVEPDCGGGFTAQTIVSAHEFGEAVTDAIPTPGSNPKYPQAWNDANGNEVGDLCTGTTGKLVAGKTTYLVQEVFDNSINACHVGNFTSP